jgi:hypothetical protein
MTDEQKAKMAAGREAAKLAKQEPNKDLEEFKAEQRETNNKILSVLETLVNKDKVIGQTMEADLLEETKVPEEVELQPLTGKQLVIFQKYFDEKDGFKAWYNVNQSIFTIEVPMKLSNMIDAHRIMYKQDLRSKKVDQNNILGSIDRWCRAVALNLSYNRKISLK